MPISSPDVDQPFACVCPVDYTGELCDQFLPPVEGNACASNPCKLGSTCETMPGGMFACICAPGFVGITCNDKDASISSFTVDYTSTATTTTSAVVAAGESVTTYAPTTQRYKRDVKLLRKKLNLS